MIDSVLAEIISKQPNKLRKEWLEDRINKLKGLNVHDHNLKVSRTIDNLNKKIKDTKCQIKY